MNRLSYGVVELSSGIADGYAPEKVFWLSRHVLSPEQERVLYYTHGNVEIRHYNIVYPDNMAFFCRLVQKFTRQGTVYAVLPQSYLNLIIEGKCPDLIVRTFSMRMSTLYHSTTEHRVSSGEYRSAKVFDHKRLAECLSRIVNSSDPAHATSSHPSTLLAM